METEEDRNGVPDIMPPKPSPTDRGYRSRRIYEGGTDAYREGNFKALVNAFAKEVISISKESKRSVDEVLDGVKLAIQEMPSDPRDLYNPRFD